MHALTFTTPAGPESHFAYPLPPTTSFHELPRPSCFFGVLNFDIAAALLRKLGAHYHVFIFQLAA